MAEITLAKLRAWLQVSPTALDDEALDQVLTAEKQIQSDACRIPTDPENAEALPEWAVQALYRRAGRECAARGVPLGLAGLDSEFGAAQVPKFDMEIERLEGRFRKWVFA